MYRLQTHIKYIMIWQYYLASGKIGNQIRASLEWYCGSTWRNFFILFASFLTCNCGRFCGFQDYVRFHLTLGCTRLKDLTGRCLHTFLGTILDMIRISEIMLRLSTWWIPFGVLAFHNSGRMSCWSNSQNIFEFFSWQYSTLIQAF